ncbi:MAG TPA: IS110 family transposase [Dehalococcoidia bacterium]|nr:MAG: hypothetical protein AMJ43_00410 [Coxiella sp. DG_40]HEY50429.1 IS110 family transposase [Dehalococcoidia bacterium]
MKPTKKKLYVGIDIHSREHKAAIVPVGLFQQTSTVWGSIRPIVVKNEYNSFKNLDDSIRSQVCDTSEVTIAVDHTGGHYSEPIVYYLLTAGYDVYYLESKAVKSARERLLDEENKSDIIDSIGTAYLLYLRDTHSLSFRISLIQYELGSRAAVLNSLILQRLQFVKLLNQMTNRLHQLLIATFPEGEARYFNKLLRIIPHYPTPRDIVDSRGLENVRGLSKNDREDIMQFAVNSIGVPSNEYKWLIKELGILRLDLVKKRETITLMLRKQLAEHPYTEILYSFPFLGEIAAATIIATVKNIDNWSNKKKFKKALGIYSRSTRSGNRSYSRRGKEGSKHGRRVLFQVCRNCIKRNAPDNDFKDYYSRQVNQGKVRIKALVSTMGKLAEIIYHCLRNRELYKYQGKYRKKFTKDT